MGRIFLSLIALIFILFNSGKAFAGMDKKDFKVSEVVDAEYLMSRADESSLYDRQYWKALLHYNGHRSAIRDDYFFLAKDGNRNPRSELFQTIRELLRSDLPMDNSHPICRYPARFKWIIEELKVDKELFPKPICSDFHIYLKNTAAKEIYIEFASENVNNLMSMMGHIFLRIVGQKDGVEVSHSLGYFANFSKDGVVSFIAGALFSGTSGIYILEPYGKKLMEYNLKQKRSVWEYKINFTQDQIDMLMMHIWEMKRVNAKYNFVTHNCGSALLYLLYAADPNLQKIYSPLDAPIDIIKNLYRNNYISKIEISPSDSYKFRMLSDNFLESDRALMESFVKGDDIKLANSYLSDQERSNILKGIEVVLDYKLANKDLNQSDYDLLRMKVDNLSKSLPKNNLVWDVKNPLKKNDSSRTVVGYKNQGSDKNHINFGFYPIYNSLNENNSEYFNEFELQLANLEGGYYTDSDVLKLDNFDLIKMKNIIPYDYLVDGFSGSFKINFERERFDAKSNRMFPNLNFGGGLGKNFFGKKVTLYSMASFGYSYFRHNRVAYTNPEIGAVFRQVNFGKTVFKHLKYISSNQYKYKSLSAIEQSFFIKENHDIVLSYNHTQGGIEKSFNSLSLEYQRHF